jgi:valyl-tRNA synthetase
MVLFLKLIVILFLRDMVNKYNTQEVEEKIRKFWNSEKIYKFDLKRKGSIFSIDTPPPYISGRMHIGHAFSYSQQDFIARFWRMKENVFYPFGTDDNGLPTERFIEKINKVKSKKMSRAEFIKLSLNTIKKETPSSIEDFKILGISADYNIYYSTIDDHSRKISQKSFIDLYKNNLVYRKKVPTPWCVDCQTSIAQAELEDKEQESLFSTLKFNVDGNGLLIATTRPELLNACVAVFVNPNDKRYKHLVGKKAKVPLFDFEVPIIADNFADMEKGTGVLMICSYGDRFDVDAINKHKLKPKIILNEDGTINQGKFKGLKIKEAREKILQELRKNNLVISSKDISHVVNVHDKCGCEVEFIPTEQWFIKILNKKEKLIKQGKKINWYPKFMFKRYENWIKGLEWDWSISRNRHFGVPMPVWYCGKCNEIIIANEKELPIDPLQTKKKCKCGGEAEGEKMVFDTWATSSLTPQIAAGLIKGKVKIPFSLRPQAHDIIRTWAFYTIVKSLYHENEIPWKDIMVSGYVTLGKEKMSKSKGNVVNPKEVLEEYGADALRFWAAGSKLGEDLVYQEQDLVAGKRFITKLFNASRFVFMNLDDFNGEKPEKLEKIDKLFLAKVNLLIQRVTENYEKYEYSKAKADIEKFFWHDFADNYLEIVKKRIYQNKKGKKSAQYVLYESLLAILKLIAPIMPFITEEIYQNHFKKNEEDKSIHISKWPEAGNEKDTKEFDLFIKILSDIRQAKTNAKKSMNAECIISIDKRNYEKIKNMLEDLKDVMNAKEIKTEKFKVDFI